MTTTGDRIYPFTGIVGMADLKLALLLNAVSPAIGGVLVRGEKGTAKSTMVRGLAALLPPVPVVPGCPYSCDPAAPDPSCPAGPHPGPHPGEPAAVELRPVTLAELPVGATEDRLTGSLDIERVLTAGTTAFSPGLLAAAHRGVLYVDEVNLLHDHLVDLLLDAAALGVNYVEREGVSVRHASRFLLVGTMNPEEGELRPQLLDRFGLTVLVSASHDAAERADVVRRRLAFESDPAAFADRFAADTVVLAERVAVARDRLAQVELPDAALRQICAVCGAFGVDGMRADLVTARTAIALAAWGGRDVVTEEDVRAAARLALPHRRRRDPFDAPGLDEQALDDALREASQDLEPTKGQANPDRPEGPAAPEGPASREGPAAREGPSGPDDLEEPDHPSDPTNPSGPDDLEGPDRPANPEDPEDDPDPGGPDGSSGTGNGSADSSARSSGPAMGAPASSPVAPAAPFRARLLTVPGTGEGAPGRRSAARGPFGRTVEARVPLDRPFALHLPATVRAAVTRSAVTRSAVIPTPDLAPPAAQASRPMIVDSSGQRAPETVHDHEIARRGVSRRVVLAPGDLREAVREGKEGNLVLFAVDASGSMAARQRMRMVKGAVLSLLLDAYQRRDKVGLVTFRGTGAELALPPTSSVEAAARRLTHLATGGRTPLAAGLAKAARVLATERLRDPRRRPLLIVVTDGRATSGSDADLTRAAAMLSGLASVVVDCEASVLRLGLAERLAVLLGGSLFRLDELEAGSAGSDLAAVARQLTRGKVA